MKFVAKVVSLGRVTIPSELRELHGIQEGDMVRVTIVKIKKKKENSQ